MSTDTEIQHIEPEFGLLLPENESAQDTGFPTGIIVLTEEEKALVRKMGRALNAKPPAINKSDVIYKSIKSRIKRIKQLAGVIAHFPSLLDRKAVFDNAGNSFTLIGKLLDKPDGDYMLHLPTKATLGKGFLVAKFRLFMYLSNLAQAIKMPQGDVAALKAITSALLFTLMAEDVYLNLMDDTGLPDDTRRMAAMWLMLLWDRRTDIIAKDVAPVLQAVWDARKKLHPAVGVLKGNSETWEIVQYLPAGTDSKWVGFIRWESSLAKESDEKDMKTALYEFLFGLSAEQIETLEKMTGTGAAGADEIARYLGKDIKTDLDTDLRDFYMFYTVRRDNARARKRLGLSGPCNTLEDYYIRFELEQHKEDSLSEILL